jgi:hypothetical protein
MKVRPTYRLALTAACLALVTGACSSPAPNVAETTADRGATHVPGATAGGGGAAHTTSSTKNADPGKRKTEKEPKTHQPATGDAGSESRATEKDKSTPAAGTAKTSGGSKKKASQPGGTHPRNQKSVLDSLPGNTSEKCVAVGKRTDVRSGSMAAGNFAQARQSFRSATGPDPATVHLYFVPEQSGASPTLTVTMTSPDGGKATVSSNQVETANTWSYYSVELPVPSSGTWMLHARAGTNRGCFKIRFGSA